MPAKKWIKRARKLARAYQVTNGRRFRLKRIDPDDTSIFNPNDKKRAKAVLTEGVQALASLQDRLYAQDQWSVLLIFQAMDAAGKDGAIKHVMSGVNPQGCQVFSFKAPSDEDLDHTYLWRCMRSLPERGRIGIFNRSYYEETLAVRVHPEFLAKQKLPSGAANGNVWKRRFEEITNFEQYLAANGVVILKFFLHLSAAEQRRRFLARLDNPAKNWKFSTQDIAERKHWKAYMDVYEDTIRHTASKEAPWYVVPADNKWFTRLVVAAAVVDRLNALDLKYPTVTAEQQKQLAAARRQLR
jgi:PPK2 family polyphosphate:nucleotide phosphotransferase